MSTKPRIELRSDDGTVTEVIGHGCRSFEEADAYCLALGPTRLFVINREEDDFRNFWATNPRRPDPIPTVPAEHFMGTIAVNVDNGKLSDAAFREFIRNTLPIVVYPRKVPDLPPVDTTR